MTEFQSFPKMARLSRECIITEKIDGTNAQVCIVPVENAHLSKTEHVCIYDGKTIFAGSRNRWITPDDDNFGFAAWVRDNGEMLARLGPGRHFGEWWGSGIQRRYGLTDGDRRLSLFNVQRWHAAGEKPREFAPADPRRPSRFTTELPPCVGTVPVLHIGDFESDWVDEMVDVLRGDGSRAAPGFMNPEGVVVYHVAGNVGFKKTLDRDGMPKSLIGGAS